MPPFSLLFFPITVQKESSYEKTPLRKQNQPEQQAYPPAHTAVLSPVLLPTFAAFIIGFLVPFVWGSYLSFCKFNTPKDATFIGIGNYLKLFNDPGFLNAFKNTALVTVVSVVVINVFAFAVAYALTQKLKGSNLSARCSSCPTLSAAWCWGISGR